MRCTTLSMPMLLQVIVVATLGHAAFAEQQPESVVAENTIYFVIQGLPMSGKPILPATVDEFRLKESVTGEVFGFRWTQLEEGERHRVQKLYGLEVDASGLKKFGEKVIGVRFHLQSGKPIEGLRIPERDRSGLYAIRTAATPVIWILMSEIKSQEPIEGFESDFYSAHELYEKCLNERAPGDDDAAAHMDLAHKAASMELYSEAIDQLKMAEIIDPRTEERHKDFCERLVSLHAEQQAAELYSQLLNARHMGEFFRALEILDRLDRSFAYSDMKSRWESMRVDIEAGKNAELRKQVVLMSYPLMSELIKKRMSRKVKIDVKGNLVPSIPGKMVTTRQGQIFKGVIVSTDPTEIVLKEGTTTTRISKKDVMMESDVDLSKAAREIYSDFAALKSYVTDLTRPDGLKMEMIKRISQVLKAKENEVKEILNNRLEVERVVSDGEVKITNLSYASDHEVDYGDSSWLREGARFIPLGGPQLRGGSSSPTPRGGPKAQQNNEDPENSDDPEVWWKFQRFETRLNLLQAIAAEKVFAVVHVRKTLCKNCEGGIITAIPVNGETNRKRCPKCRGVDGGVLFQITYH